MGKRIYDAIVGFDDEIHRAQQRSSIISRQYGDWELNSADPTQLADYLLSRGWVLQEQIGEKATVWDLPEQDAELWLPLQKTFRDFRRVMSETFGVLEAVEHRPISAILHDLSLKWADISRFRVETGLFSAPTIPLSDGVSLVRSTRDAIVSGARWLVEPKAAYYTRPLGQISRFLKNLRLGQTEVGSYVITVISPLTTEAPSNADVGPVFARDAMMQVMRAVGATKNAAVAANARLSLEPFDTARDEGINANLCDALVVLGESSPDNAVEIQFSWSTRIPYHGEASNRIILDSSIIRTLKPAAEHLRSLEPEPRITLRGLVKEMSDRTAADRQSEVTLVADIDGKLRRVRFVLRGAFRQSAIEAFDERLPLVVTGTLNRSGVPYSFTDISSVRLIGENDEMLPQRDISELIDDDED